PLHRHLGRARPYRHPDLDDLPDLRGQRRSLRLRAGQCAVDPGVHRRGYRLGAGVPAHAQAGGDPLMADTAADPRVRARRVRWLTEVGWKYPLAAVVIFLATFPLLYVVSVAVAENSTLTGSTRLFTSFSTANFAALAETS